MVSRPNLGGDSIYTLRLVHPRLRHFSFFPRGEPNSLWVLRAPTVYYLSKRLHDYKTRYTPIEKSYFGLVWAIQKLRHVFLAFQVWIVARMDLLNYLFEKPTLSGRLSRWLILLAKFELKYVARKTIKGNAILLCRKPL